jgi:hypothetical protein
MAKLKAEFLQHYYDANGVPLRSKLIANFNNSAKLGALLPGMYNFVMTNKGMSNVIKKFSGFAKERSMPTMHKVTLKKWYKKHHSQTKKMIKNRIQTECIYSAMSLPTTMTRRLE